VSSSAPKARAVATESPERVQGRRWVRALEDTLDGPGVEVAVGGGTVQRGVHGRLSVQDEAEAARERCSNLAADSYVRQTNCKEGA
jgi:hypothetical protein